MQREDIEDIYTLSPMQEGILFHSLHQADQATYLQQVGLTFVGALDAGRFRAAWQGVLDRHPALRTGFRWERLDKPLQVVHTRVDTPLEELDWRALDEAEWRARERDLLASHRADGFDLSEPPLLRMALARLGDDRHRFVISAHHIMLDGWSTAVVLSELSELYDGLAGGREPDLAFARPFRAYLEWLREHEDGQAETFWRHLLRGHAEPTPLLRGHRATPAASRPQEARHAELSQASSQRLRETAARERLTLSTMVQGAWALLLSRYSGRADVVFGSVSSGRPSDLDGVEGMVGLFVNTLPLRLTVDHDRRALDWLQQVQETALRARAAEHVPLTRVQEHSDVPPGRDLFETVQVLQNIAQGQALEVWEGFEGLRVEDFAYSTRTNYPLTLTAIPDDRLALRVSHDPDWLSPRMADRLLGHLGALLAELGGPLDRRLGDLVMVGDEERAAVAGWGQGRGASQGPGAAASLAARQGAARGDAVALDDGEAQRTYAALDADTARLAARLREAGVGEDHPVAVLLPRTAEQATAVLAVLRSGAAVVPLDPGAPRDRVKQALEAVRPTAVVTDGAHAAGLPEVGAVTVLVGGGAGAAPAPEAADAAASADALAAVVATRGTTGAPKLVPLTHGALDDALGALRELAPLGADDVVAATGPPDSAAALLELLLAVGSGARLRALDSGVAADPDALADALERAGATCAVLAPSTLRALRDLPGLRTVVATGERCGADVADRWAAGRRLVAAYGAAECAGLAVAGTRQPGERAHCGRPVGDAVVEVRDAAGQLAPVGVIGELWVGGGRLTPGYLDRPALTAERFVATTGPDGQPARRWRSGDLARWTDDGDLEVLDRADRELDVRGRSIDAWEVEDTLRAQPDVRDAAVTAHGVDRDRRLAAHVVLAPDTGGAADTTDFGADGGEMADDQVGQWRAIYEHTYGNESVEEDPELNIAGWNSSYTGEAIPAEQMREWRDATLASLRAPRPGRVLEIGCGTGMLLLPLAAECDEYWGTDLSPAALAYVARQLEDPARADASVTLREQEASDATGIPEGHFDLVVLNSVVQYFPTAQYLRETLAVAARALAPGGRLFVGDVRDLGLQEEFQLDMRLAAAADRVDGGQAWHEALAAARVDEELVVHPDFFRRFAAGLDRDCAVRVAAKRGRPDNELTRFRYDATLQLDPPAGDREPAVARDWAGDGLDLAAVEALLADGPDEAVLAGVPNARVRALAGVARGLRGGASRARAAAELRAEAQRPDGVHPEDLWALADRLGYDADLLRERDGDSLTALLRRRGADTAALPAASALWHVWERRLGEPRAAPECASDPLTQRLESGRLAALQHRLESVLPAELVPESVLGVERLPLGADGRVAHGRLTLPGRAADAGRREFVAPRDETEELVARVWEEVLGVRPVGATDDFFELGGHSLVAMRVVSRLQRELARDLELALLLDRPTVEGLAAAIRELDDGEARSSLIVMREEGTRPPFFCVHPSGSNTLVFRPLADLLGPDQPFYALEAPDLEAFDSIEAVAAHYAETIRDADPEGPYRLGGLSFGGLVAFEVARQLTADGYGVDLVAMFETSLRRPGPPLPLTEDLVLRRTMAYAKVIEWIFQRSIPLSPDDLCGLCQRQQLELLYERAGADGTLGRDIGPQLIRGLVESVRTAQRLLQTYDPGSYDGPVWLYKALDPMPDAVNDPEFYRPEADLGWGAVANRLEIVEVPGDHLTLLTRPHVDVLAEHLAGLLRAAAVEGAG